MKGQRSNRVLFHFFIFPVPQCSFPVLVTFKFNTRLCFVLFCFVFVVVVVVVLEPIFVLYLPEQPLPRALRFSHCTEASAKREWLATKRKGLWEGVSPVFSFPPSVARKFSLRERRLGTRQLPVHDFIQTYNPTVFTMKLQINLQNIGEGINQQLLKSLFKTNRRDFLDRRRVFAISHLPSFPRTFKFILLLVLLLLLLLLLL